MKGKNFVQVKKIRRSNNDAIGRALLTQFQMQRSHNLLINGPILQLKDTKLMKKLGIQNFYRSVRYIQWWHKHHAIVWEKISTETAAVSENVCDFLMKTVQLKIREGYNDEDF